MSMSTSPSNEETRDNGDAFQDAANSLPMNTCEQHEDDEKESPESSSRRKTSLQGSDIASILQSRGPIVKAVLLRHIRVDGKDTRPHLHLDSNEKVDPKQEKNHRPILEELIDEVEIDTTPSKEQVKQILGGPFTFLGQWPSEGTVVMARKDFVADLPTGLHKLSIAALRKYCRELDIDTSHMLEKSDLIAALEERRSQALPLNPHRLQPPLEDAVARGDILVMKVAETKDDDDKDDEPAELELMTNEEFFLNYTREEYVHFASRMDVVAQQHDDSDEEEGEEEEIDEELEEEAAEKQELLEETAEDDDEEEEEEEEYQLEEDVDKHSLLNLVLGSVIEKFREDNGRGPNSQELLELRSVVASELDVEIPLIPTTTDRRRTDPEEGDDVLARSSKRVKFAPECNPGNPTDAVQYGGAEMNSAESLPIPQQVETLESKPTDV